MNKNSSKTSGGPRRKPSSKESGTSGKPKPTRRRTAPRPPVPGPLEVSPGAVIDPVPEVAATSPPEPLPVDSVTIREPMQEPSGDEPRRGGGQGRSRGRRGGRGRGRGRRSDEPAVETAPPADRTDEHATVPPITDTTHVDAANAAPVSHAPAFEPSAEDHPFGIGLVAPELVHPVPFRSAPRPGASPSPYPAARSGAGLPTGDDRRSSPREALDAPRPATPREPTSPTPSRTPDVPPPHTEATTDRRQPPKESDHRRGQRRGDRDRRPARAVVEPVGPPARTRPDDEDEAVEGRVERFSDEPQDDGAFREGAADLDDDLFPEVAPPPADEAEVAGEKDAGRRGGRRRRGRRTRGRAPETAGVADDELDVEAPVRVEPEETEEEPESFDEELEEEPLPEDYQWVEAKIDRPKPREMVINVSGHDECRIAILQDGRLEELFIERTSSQSHVGNIYKGKVTNVEPSIQAAFVDFGLPKNGFLHISDVQPQYFPNHSGAGEDVGRKIPRHHRPPIQKCFRRGQEVIVQITKEGVGTKGPTLTTYLSMPGRFLVMMPGMNRHGVSRKIEDEQARRQMRDVLNQLTFPPGMGFILRTAGMDRTKRELQRDLHYLTRLWKRVVERVRRHPAPAELYRESDLITRTIRDCYTADFDRVIVDDVDAAKKVSEFLRVAMPRSRPPVELYSSKEPMFHRLGVEEEIERINARHVPLQSGGSLVIDSTEALVAIDVNSGRFRSLDDAEETALRINMEASEEIARQLRLRDLGGLIVCDFIDMRLERNRRKVERALRDALKKHKERARCLRMSAFGLIEMTRQRQGPSLKRNIYADCAHCRGSGLVKMPESVMLDVMRRVQLGAYDPRIRKVSVTVSSGMAYQILNSKRAHLSRIETETGAAIVIRGDANFTTDQIECLYEDGRGQPVPVGN